MSDFLWAEAYRLAETPMTVEDIHALLAEHERQLGRVFEAGVKSGVLRARLRAATDKDQE